MAVAARRNDRSRNWLDRLSYAGFLAALLFLAFVLGALAAVRNWPVATVVRDACRAARALSIQQELNAQRYPKYLWFPAVADGKGLTGHDPDRSTAGYTLYTSGDGARAILLNRDGEQVYQWEAPFSAVWPNPEHVPAWISDRSIYIRRAHVFPNGGLLALYETPSHTPPGCGLARLDRNSRVVWTFDDNAHHDFSLDEDGRIYVLTQRVRRSPLKNWEHLWLPAIEEFISILSPDGEELKRFSLFELLGESEFYRPLVTPTDQTGDVLHSNTVHVIGESFAQHYGSINAGDLMVCLRNLDLVVVINLPREEIVWATTGPWRLPHDPDPLANGRILIFDNCFARGRRQGSRVLEFDPSHGSVAWKYTGSDEAPFRSDVRSCQQLLAGGNVLITESDRGRIFEVTRDGDIVWEYVHPVRGGEDPQLIPIVSAARRYNPQQLPFLSADRSGGGQG